MVVLTDYQQFGGRHHETGSVHNVLAYSGYRAPHTNQPISEALLLGISGGVAFGYFTFEYTGYPPHIVLLTRNTFDPLESIFDRLAIPREIIHSTSTVAGREKLVDVLEGGQAPLVWGDQFSLPYNTLPFDENNWLVMPVVVYGVDDETAYLADRSRKPLIVSASDLAAARGRVKKYKRRIMTLGEPDWERLGAAVSKGIWQCISLYLEAPPKGKRDSFGLAGLQYWAKMLTNTRNKNSWARYFPPGERLWMALVGNGTQPGVYRWLAKGERNCAERGMYADFLDEASIILNKQDLKICADLFREAESAWRVLLDTLLPDDILLLAEARALLDQKQKLFVEQGSAATGAIQQVNAALQRFYETARHDFPLDDASVVAYRERLAEQVLQIHTREKAAVEALQSAMS